MDRRGVELKVGIAVILALVVLIGGIIWIKGCEVARQTYTVKVAFDEVSGLTEGDPVTVHGVTKGFVKKIELGKAQVYADISMDKAITITPDTEFVIKNIGLMGEKYVSVRLGKEVRKLEPGQVLSGRFESGVPEVVGEIGVALKEFERTVMKVHSVLEEVERSEDISGTLGDLRAFSRGVRGTVEENRDDVRKSVEDLRYSSEKLKEFAQNRGPGIDSTVVKITQTAEDAQRLMGRMESASIALEAVIHRIESGQGSLGKLVNDDELYKDLKATLQEAKALIADIKQHPKRYMKFSLF
ncbi:MAG: MlaD family protein [Candidatus Eisenbacteria bacterium]